MTVSVVGWAVLVLVILVFLSLGRRAAWVGYRVKLLLAALCVVALVVIVATDWPSEALNTFWAEHSVLSALVTTVLLFGAGFVAYDIGNARRQEELDDSITASGLGGMVETLADIDFALSALLAGENVEARRDPQGKPLRWVRVWREEIEHDHLEVRPLFQVRDLAELAASDSWRVAVEGTISECLRRLSGGVRDWAPLLTTTRDGTESLVRVARIRSGLMALEQLSTDASSLAGAQRLWDVNRAECRVLALGFEIASGAYRPRWYTCVPASVIADQDVARLTSHALGQLPRDGSTERSRAHARKTYLAFTPSKVA